MAKKTPSKKPKAVEESEENKERDQQELEGDEQHEPTDEEIENEEAQQDAVDEEDNVDPADEEVSEDESAPEEKKVLTCPKCHAKYDEAHMEDKEAIVHGTRDAKGDIQVSYYCPPCALSWLERSSAKLA